MPNTAKPNTGAPESGENSPIPIPEQLEPITRRLQERSQLLQITQQEIRSDIEILRGICQRMGLPVTDQHIIQDIRVGWELPASNNRPAPRQTEKGPG